MKYHPDRIKTEDAKAKSEAEEKFKEISKANELKQSRRDVIMTSSDYKTAM